MKIKFRGIAALLACGFMFTACSDDDEKQIDTEGLIDDGSDQVAAYVVAGNVGSEAAYIMKSGTLDEGMVSAIGNGLETSYARASTWLFFGNRYLYRLAYSMGQDGLTAAFRLNDNGQVQLHGECTINNFTSYGTYENKIITSATGATDLKDAAGHAAYGITFSIIDVDNMTVDTKVISAENFLGNGEYVMLSGLLEANGKVYAGVVPLGCTPYGIANNNAVLPGNEDLVATKAGGTGGGMYEAGTLSGTQYPDECYVAIFDDATFSHYTIAKTDKMSWAAGRMAAAYYQTVWAADNGDIYVFSPSYAKLQADSRQKTTHPSSVMRIKAGTTEFDNTYLPFDIEAAAAAAESSAAKTVSGTRRDGSGGHGGSDSGTTTTDNSKAMYRCWHITGDYFLLQMYAKGINARGQATTKMAIFKGEDRTFRYVTGLPDESTISSFSVKNPYNENGVCYIGVTTTDGLSPRVYSINPITATATPGLSVEIDEVGAVGKLIAQ